MKKSLRSSQNLAIFAVATSTMVSTFSAQAADPAPQQVIVTGTHIRGAAESTALPIRVISSEDLALQGAPTMIEMVKALPEAAGSMGDSNQFQPGRGQGFEGSGSVNLRGIGPDRTLILLNGKRLPLVSSYIVNTFNLPMSAIQKVEIMRDGAAATYGSDAIGGIVNFITKKNVKGVELGGSFRDVRSTKGDYDADITWGTVGNDWNLMISGGIQHRSELKVTDRSWSPRSYTVNPNAGWSFSVNPSQFIPVGNTGPGGTLAPVGARAVDVGCTKLGGIMPFAGFCTQQFTVWENLVEEQNSAQVYAEFNKELGSNTKLHLEAAFANTRVPRLGYPPSFNQPKAITETVLPSNINPASFVAGTTPRLFNNWFVPMTNPGMAAYAAANPSQFPAGTTGVFIPIGQWRPYFAGGNPMNPAEGVDGVREQDQFRVSGGLSGLLGETMSWDANVTFGSNNHYLKGYDTPGVNLQLALRGLGGAGCDFTTGTPGVGPCQWLNPMSNAISGAPELGITTNPGYNAAVRNTADMANWLFQSQESWLKSQILEINGGLTGELPSWKMPGGSVGWAAGVQLRRNTYETRYSKLADRQQSPCMNSVLNIPGANTCNPSPNTPLGLAVANNPVNESANVRAVYGEINLPYAKGQSIDLAARYEDYGDKGGDTFNPQIRAKIQALPFLAFRGSVGTTFRAPPQAQLIADPATTLQTVLGTFRSADLVGNPALKPETAKTFNLGAIVQAGDFDGALDYYSYEFKDIITAEPLNPIVTALFPAGATGANNCSTLDAGFISSHFVFAGACSATNLTRVLLQRINGPKATINGLDLRASYRFRNVMGGNLSLGAFANKILDYKFDEFKVAGVTSPAFDAVGKLNVGTLAHPLPRYKGQAYVNMNHSGVNVRWTTRYNAGYVDQRVAATVVGGTIPSTTLHDLAVLVDGPYGIVFTVALNNMFDKDPAFTRTEYSYDPLTGDPLGRALKVSLRKKF